jgi:hypothetical protein
MLNYLCMCRVLFSIIYTLQRTILEFLYRKTHDNENKNCENMKELVQKKMHVVV